MPFVVPKFINRETRLIGPLSPIQVGYLGSAGVTCFILYFFISSIPFFIAICIVLVGIASIFAFGKINGRPIILMIKNFFMFSLSSKMYIWKKSRTSPKIIKVKKKDKEQERETSPLNLSQGSRLKSLSSKIETGQK